MIKIVWFALIKLRLLIFSLSEPKVGGKSRNAYSFSNIPRIVFDTLGRRCTVAEFSIHITDETRQPIFSGIPNKQDSMFHEYVSRRRIPLLRILGSLVLRSWDPLVLSWHIHKYTHAIRVHIYPILRIYQRQKLMQNFHFLFLFARRDLHNEQCNKTLTNAERTLEYRFCQCQTETKKRVRLSKLKNKMGKDLPKIFASLQSTW